MCEPVSIMMGISAVAGLVGQQQQAKAHAKSNAVQYSNALQARDDNANQINLQGAQQADQASQKINQNNIATREAMASQVAQGGPSGLSMDSLLGHIAGLGAGYNDSVNQNLDRVNLAGQSQLTNVNRQTASTVNSLVTPQRPDYLGAALKIGGAAYTGGAFNSTPAAKLGAGGGYIPIAGE